MKAEILDIAEKLYHNHLTPETATNLLLDLFAVSDQSEQLVCNRCGSSKLEHCGGSDYSCEECGHFQIAN